MKNKSGELNELKCLNLGCGKDYKEGYVNITKVVEKDCPADLIHDLNKFPYPFKNNSVDYVLMKHILEHLNDVQLVMEEIYRILKPNGIVEITMPNFSNFQAWGNPEHKHAFNWTSFNHFLTGYESDTYTNAKFKKIRIRLEHNNKLINWFINRFKHLYTSTCLAYLIPQTNLLFIFEKVK